MTVASVMSFIGLPARLRHATVTNWKLVWRASAFLGMFTLSIFAISSIIGACSRYARGVSYPDDAASVEVWVTGALWVQVATIMLNTVDLAWPYLFRKDTPQPAEGS